MVFAARTVIVSMLVGTLVTLVAGLIPAWRATRVPPVAALRDADPGAHKVRLPARAVRGLASLLGRPAEKLGGSAGALARRNAMRHPGRTAATASALMIGVALVTLVTVIAQGLRDTTSGTLDKRIAATHVITGADGWSPTDPAVARAVSRGARHHRRDRDPPGRRARVRRQGDRELDRPGHGRRAVLVRVRVRAPTTRSRTSAATARSSTRGWATEHRLDRRRPVRRSPRPKGDKLALTVKAIEKSPVLDALGLGPITIAQGTFEKAFENQRNVITLVSADSAAAVTERAEAVPGRQVADQERVHRLGDRRHRLAAGDLLRAARARRDREPVRDRQHARALDVRAHA